VFKLSYKRLSVDIKGSSKAVAAKRCASATGKDRNASSRNWEQLTFTVTLVPGT